MTVRRLKLKTLEETCKAVDYIKKYVTPTINFLDNKHYFQLQYEREFRRKDINGNSFYNFTIYGVNSQAKITNLSKTTAQLFNLKYDDKKNCIVGYDSVPEDIQDLWHNSEPTIPELKLELIH